MAEIGGGGITQDQLNAAVSAAMATRAPALGTSTTLFTLTADMNSTSDQSFVASFPFTAYVIERIEVGQATVNQTNARGGLYASASKAGDPIIPAAQTFAGLVTPQDTITPTFYLAGQKIMGATPILSLSVAQGVAATASFAIMGVGFNI